MLPHKDQFIRYIKGALRIMLLDSKAEDYFERDWNTAIRSFVVLFFAFPVAMLQVWFSNHTYVSEYGANPAVYMGVHMLGSWVTLAGGLYIVWLLAKWEGVQGNFPHFLTASNWFSPVATLVLLPLYLAADGPWLPHSTRVTVAILYFAVLMVYGWFVAWRFLKVNPLYAAGVVTAPSIFSTLVFDFINNSQFGIARPFFAEGM